MPVDISIYECQSPSSFRTFVLQSSISFALLNRLLPLSCRYAERLMISQAVTIEAFPQVRGLMIVTFMAPLLGLFLVW